MDGKEIRDYRPGIGTGAEPVNERSARSVRFRTPGPIRPGTGDPMEENGDRRVRRTKRRLKAALHELIDERGYEAITIRDLTDRADVGRSTFYAHFGSKEDLLFAGFDRWLLDLATGAPCPADPRDGDPEAAGGLRFARPLLEHARTAKPFFRATIADGADPRVRRRTIAILSEVIEAELARAGDPGGAPEGIDPDAALEARSRALAGAFLSLLGWWLEEAEWLDAGVIEGIFRDLVAAGRPVTRRSRVDATLVSGGSG